MSCEPDSHTFFTLIFASSPCVYVNQINTHAVTQWGLNISPAILISDEAHSVAWSAGVFSAGIGCWQWLVVSQARARPCTLCKCLSKAAGRAHYGKSSSDRVWWLKSILNHWLVLFSQMCPQCVLMVNTQKCRSSDLTSKYPVTSCHRSFSIHLPLRISFCTNHLHWYRAQVSLEKLHLAELAEPRPESDLEPLQGDSVDPCACADSVYTSRVWVLWDESFSKQREACNYLLFSWMGSKSEREHHPILLYHAAAGVGVIRRGPLLLPTRFYRPEKLHSILILQFLFSRNLLRKYFDLLIFVQVAYKWALHHIINICISSKGNAITYVICLKS